MLDNANKPIIVETSMSDEDKKLLERLLDKRIAKVKKVSITTLILAIIGLVLPANLWNILILPDRMAGNVPDVTTPMYENMVVVFILSTIVILTPLLTYYAFVYFIRKDLRCKEKLSGTFKVKRIESISKRVAEKLEGLDTILHFEKNEFKINRHLFNKKLNPELLNAQIVLIELAKYSRIVLKQEVKS